MKRYSWCGLSQQGRGAGYLEGEHVTAGAGARFIQQVSHFWIFYKKVFSAKIYVLTAARIPGG